MPTDLIDNESNAILLPESFMKTIGSRMSMNFIEIKVGISIREAMRELVAQAAENDNISTLYVTDEQHTLLRCDRLKRPDYRAREGSSLDDIIMESYPYVYARDDRRLYRAHAEGLFLRIPSWCRMRTTRSSVSSPPGYCSGCR